MSRAIGRRIRDRILGRDELRDERLRELEERVHAIEYGLDFRRFMVLDDFAGYLAAAQIPGDYLEFGVYYGRTFSYACRRMMSAFKDMRFFAFDSFEGLPKPAGHDLVSGYSSSFEEGQFRCSEPEFLDNLAKAGIDVGRVRTVKGWFDESLRAERAAALHLEKAAVAWIDCDYYESTVPVLEFIRPFLSVGTVIAFDDWRCYRNLPTLGQQRACAEWLRRNPGLVLHEMFPFGWYGFAFTVGAC